MNSQHHHKYRYWVSTVQTNWLGEFDDLSDEGRQRIYYKIIHTAKDWEPSPIQDIEFVEGFAEEASYDRTTDVGHQNRFSHLLVFTQQSFAYFRQLFVAGIRQGKWQCRFPRRFIVAGVQCIAQSTMRCFNQTDLYQIRWNQQLNLSFLVKDVRLINPMRDVYLTIVQNGNWTNAMYNIAPVGI